MMDLERLEKACQLILAIDQQNQRLCQELQDARAENKRLREALAEIASDLGPPEQLTGWDEVYLWAQERAQAALKGESDAD